MQYNDSGTLLLSSQNFIFENPDLKWLLD